MRQVIRNGQTLIRVFSTVVFAALWGCAADEGSSNTAGLSTTELDSPAAAVECKSRSGRSHQPKPLPRRGHKHGRNDNSGSNGSGQGGAASAAGGAPSTGTSTGTSAIPAGTGGYSSGSSSTTSAGGIWGKGGAPGYSGAAGAYFQEHCGDGARDIYESCDDGNLTDGDGCSSTCFAEPGWNCSNGACVPVACGNASTECRADGTCESCDDGNTISGDGCSADCNLEVGWDCWSGTCTQAICGNLTYECALTSSGDYRCEECEDGNASNGDGCSSSCMIEPNWACDGETCHPFACGDGRVDCTRDAQGSWSCESCDDGNQLSGDGCSATCSDEYTGFGGAPGFGGGSNYGTVTPGGSSNYGSTPTLGGSSSFGGTTFIGATATAGRPVKIGAGGTSGA